MPFGLWFRQPGPWVPASLCPLARSRRLAGRSPGRDLCWSRWPSPSSNFPHGQEQDLTGSLATLPVALRLSKTPDDPLHLACRGASGAAPRPNTPRASSVSMISRLTKPLHHTLSTLHDGRCRTPCKTRFRLAGCAFAGRESNPLGRNERFQFMSSPFPGLTLSLAGVMDGASSTSSPILRRTRGAASGRRRSRRWRWRR